MGWESGAQTCVQEKKKEGFVAENSIIDDYVHN